MITSILLHILANIRQIKYIKPILDKKVQLSLVAIVLVIQMLFPRTYTQAFSTDLINAVTNGISELEQTEEFPNSFPVSEDAPRWSLVIPVSAYNSLEGQTDSTPCIAARGYDLCAANEENVIAANFLPIGTKVKMPEVFGDREFTVVDRMNKRYFYRADIWMREYKDARAFGVKRIKMEVY